MVNIMLYRVLDVLFQALYLALIIRIILSWIPHNAYNPIVSFIYKATDPILRPFQNIVPTHQIGIDISPIFAFIAIGIVKNLLFRILF